MNQQLPQSINSEKQVISGMMQSKSYLWQALSVLKAEYFYSSVLARCFEEMAKNKRGDFPMLENICQGSNFDAMDFFDTQYSTTGKTEFDLIISSYKKREAIKTCYNSINALLSEDNKNPTETISNAISCLSSSNLSYTSDVKVIGELLPAEIDRLKKITKEGGEPSFIKTGISDIDKMVNIQQHDYIPLGGRPSNCKSVLASQICRNLAREGKPTLYFCLDSSRSSEVSRCLFSEAKVSLQDFNRNVNSARDFSKLQAAIDDITNWPIYYDNTRKVTTDIIYAQSQHVKSVAGGLYLVVVDFMQNIRHQTKNIRERVASVSEELHSLPSSIGCPVIPLSQLSRYQDEETKAPTLKNLKESGDIEEDADKVLMVWYPQKYPCNRGNDKYKNLLQLFIEKNKDGNTGYIDLTIIAPIYTIYNREKETNLNGFI